MLNLIYTNSKADKPITYLCEADFSKMKQVEWFQDPLIQHLIKWVDKMTVIDGFCLKDRRGVIVPPEYLSTSSKTAVMTIKDSTHIYNLTQMDDVAFAHVLRASLTQDITALTYRMLPADYIRDSGTNLFKDGVLVSINKFIDDEESWLEEGVHDYNNIQQN